MDEKLLESIEARQIRIEEKVYQIHGCVEALKVKAGVWGGVAGLIVSLGALVVSMVK